MQTHRMVRAIILGLLVSFVALDAVAAVGDPQVRTDHPWYPGELACSTFERLAKTQAALYQRVVGARPKTLWVEYRPKQNQR